MKELSVKELIDCARKCAGDGGCKECHFCDDHNDVGALILTLADKLEELSEEKWIDVKVAKPAEEDEYLVMIAGYSKSTVLHYDPEDETFYEEGIDGELLLYPVTYWAELPEAPKTAGASPRPTVGEGKEPVKRCATCRHEDRMAEEERCIECEKHSLWEERR